LYSEKASEDDTFSDNINLIVQDLEGREITLEEFNDLSIQEVKQYFEGVEIFENKEILLGDVAGYVLLYTAPSNGFNLKFLQAYFLHNGKSYILTFTQETDKTNQYETEGVRIMDTFRIK
jgi:hypothetical protein